ncbi:MAG TPA: IPT/TIG domain-containing protein [Terracidiphilus sp.]
MCTYRKNLVAQCGLAAGMFGLALILFPSPAEAGGPKYIAGPTYFNPGVMGQPVHWAGGRVNYYVDQGPLNVSIDNQHATAMVDAAAALWSAVPTAGLSLVRAGSLNEDVSSANIVAGNQTIVQPSDAAPSASSYPLAVVYDADGTVLNAVFGAYTSDPSNCENNGVMAWIDRFNPDATIGHAVIVLNGRCAVTPSTVSMMQFLLERAMGKILGLGYAQVNPEALRKGDPEAAAAWPIMQPASGACGPAGGTCVPQPDVLHFDDIAALNRIYPVNADNLSSFPGKVLTAANTVSIDGAIAFRTGLGMQGVNVVARPLDANGNPLKAYTVTAVSGAYFGGKHGNAVNGTTDSNGLPYSQWGSTDPALQGYFDLRYMPLPPGVTTATYQITFEAINPLFIQQNTVGPYVDGSPLPSGTLAPITLANLSAAMGKTLAVNVADSGAVSGSWDAISTEAVPRMLPPSGLWCGRLSQVGQTDWLIFPVRGMRTFTVITEALDESGRPTNFKAMPVIGAWDAFAAPGTAPVGAAPGLNGNSTGESWLQISANGDDVVRLGIGDMRGDGRPDYTYNAWVLYVDRVDPQRLPAAGGPIAIHGMGFHIADTVLVGGQPAQITSVSPNEITAIAPPAATGVTGSVDVEVDDLPVYYAIAVVPGGLSYDAGSGDALTLVTAPNNTVPIGVPLPFTVTALDPQLDRAGGVRITYSVLTGSATLSCGRPSCQVTASGDGSATLNVTAVDSNPSVVTASLSNGSSLQAHFSGGTPPVLSGLTPSLSLAAGATFIWTTQALTLKNGAPLPGQSVTWQGGTAISVGGSGPTVTDSSGIATKTLTVGPLEEGQTATASACLNGTSQCITYQAFGARPEYASLQAVAGTAQSLSASATPGIITLRVLDMNGNPMAGGVVTLHQSLYAWSPPCPARGRCAQPQLLGTQAAIATSGLDGTASFTPASLPGVATMLSGVAAAGSTSTLRITVEQYP